MPLAVSPVSTAKPVIHIDSIMAAVNTREMILLCFICFTSIFYFSNKQTIVVCLRLCFNIVLMLRLPAALDGCLSHNTHNTIHRSGPLLMSKVYSSSNRTLHIRFYRNQCIYNICSQLYTQFRACSLLNLTIAPIMQALQPGLSAIFTFNLFA